MRLTLPLACLLLAVGLAAQGAVPPPLLTQLVQDPILNPPTIPGTETCQVHTIPHPGRPGFFIAAFTEWRSLPGGPGGLDLFTGVYDAVNKTFTADQYAAGLNTPTTEFGLTLLHSGLVAVYESNGGASAVNQVWLASRPNLTSQFTPLGPITNMPTANSQLYWDPSLAVVGGKLFILHMLANPAGGADIAMSDLDLSRRLIGATKVIIRTPVAGQDANSPTPIVDSSGELIAVSFHCQDPTNRNDHYMAFDLDPGTAAVAVLQHPDWINNGGFIAGTFYHAWSGTSPAAYRIGSVESAWWTGGRAAVGKAMEITVCAPIQGPTAIPWLSFFMISKGFWPAGIPIPGVTGLFGLDPSLLLTVTVGSHSVNTGRASLNLAVPNDPSLKGVVLPGQSCTINPRGSGGGPQIILGNTAALTVL